METWELRCDTRSGRSVSIKAGDIVRLKKSHPAVRRWNSSYTIKKWADNRTPLLVIREWSVYQGTNGYCAVRWEVMGPKGDLGNFDDDLLTTRGVLR